MATLREYFDTDFSYTTKLHCRMPVGDTSVEAVVLYDFSGYTGVLSCYMSGDGHTLSDYVDLLRALDYGKTQLGLAGKVTLPSNRDFSGEMRVTNLPGTIQILARFH